MAAKHAVPVQTRTWRRPRGCEQVRAPIVSELLALFTPLELELELESDLALAATPPA